MKKGKSFSYARYGYYFSIPFIVAFVIFWLYPILYTAIIGFTDLKGLGKTSFKFLTDPLQNFKTVLTSASFTSWHKRASKSPLAVAPQRYCDIKG